MARAMILFYAVIVVAARQAAAIPITSTFDTDLDGWSMVSSNGTLTWQGAAGNPDGFALFTDTRERIGTIKAPPKFLGDLSTFEGGELSFDYVVQELGARIDRFLPIEVTIFSGSRSYSITAATPDASWETLGWQVLSVPLTAAQWGAEPSLWDQVLANVTDLRISVESAANRARPYDTDGIDNITLAPLGEPKPEPATISLLTLGAIALFRRGLAGRR